MQFEFASAPATGRQVPMKFLGLALEAEGSASMPAAPARLHFVLHLTSADAQDPGGQGVVSSLCIVGLAPSRLRGVHVRDGAGDGVSLASLDSHAGRPVTAGDMLLAMSRMAGLVGLWLDLRGIGLRRADLAVELLVDSRGVQADAVEVVAVVQPAVQSAQTFALDAELPRVALGGAWPEDASHGV